MPFVRGGARSHDLSAITLTVFLTVTLGACATGPMNPTEKPPVEPATKPTESKTSTQASDSAPQQAASGGAQSAEPNQAAAESEGRPQDPGEMKEDGGSEGQPQATAAMQEAGEQASGATTYGLEASEDAGFEQMQESPTGTRSGEGQPGGAPPPGTGETQDEAVGRLDRSLDESLSEFDETLLGAQEALQAKKEEGEAASAMGGGGAEGASSYGGTYGRDGQKRDAEEGAGLGSGAPAEASGSRDASEPVQSSGSRGGIARTHDPSGKTVPREDIPDSQDDDIVARQLREAAEQETDPELKERLWEEYRKYKEGSSRRASSS